MLTNIYLFVFFCATKTLSPDTCRPMLYDEANTSNNCPRLTGIPPHVAILNEMATLKEMIRTSSDDVKNAFRDELNDRGIGGERFQANEVLEGVKKIHERMERIVASGLMFGGERGREGGTTTNLAPAMVVAPQSTVPILVEQDTEEGTRRKMYCWGGRLHNIPEHFIIPRMTLHTLIVYWYCGSVQPHCPPLQYVRAFDFPKKKSMAQRISQMKKIIMYVRKAAHEEGFYIRPSGITTTTQATQLYEAIKKKFEHPAINERIRRHESIGWKTYYNIMSKEKWRFQG
jgi:hypothetical protein